MSDECTEDVQQYIPLLLFAHQNDSESLFAKLPPEMLYEIIGCLPRSIFAQWILRQFGRKLRLSEIHTMVRDAVGIAEYKHLVSHFSSKGYLKSIC